jgi:hypothetical protein
MTKFVGEHDYSDDEKRSHLCDFVDAMKKLLASPDLREQYPQCLAAYTECIERGRLLLVRGFTQTDLSALSRSFQPVLWSHPHWDPPTIQRPDGKWFEPEWYSRLESFHQPAADAARHLNVVGELKYSD